MQPTNGCAKCEDGAPKGPVELAQVLQRGRLISALFGGVVAGLSPQAKPIWVGLFLRVGGTALAAWNLAVFIENERGRR
jgi:hypothetical protein